MMIYLNTVEENIMAAMIHGLISYSGPDMYQDDMSSLSIARKQPAHGGVMRDQTCEIQDNISQK